MRAPDARAALLALVVCAVAGCGRSPVRVVSESMAPTLAPGDVLFPTPLADPAREVRRGMVVVYEWFEGVPFSEPGALLVFRVVGLPGDRVSLRRDTLRVNGRVVLEPYAQYAAPEGWAGGRARPPQSEVPDVTVPRGTVYVLGDNRLNALDSRYHGPVPLGALRGAVDR